jgi:hypothetical protein
MKSVAAAVVSARVTPFIFYICNQLSILLENITVIISRDPQFFQKSRSHLNILDARRVT